MEKTKKASPSTACFNVVASNTIDRIDLTVECPNEVITASLKLSNENMEQLKLCTYFTKEMREQERKNRFREAELMAANLDMDQIGQNALAMYYKALQLAALATYRGDDVDYEKRKAEAIFASPKEAKAKGCFPYLNKEQELHLLLLYKTTDVQEYKDAAWFLLFYSNFKILLKLREMQNFANPMDGSDAVLDKADIVGNLHIAMNLALIDFDCRMGARFNTFLRKKCQGELSHDDERITTQIGGGSIGDQRLRKRYLHFKQAFVQKYNREPTVEEAAAGLSKDGKLVTVQQLRTAQQSSLHNIMDIDGPYGDGKNTVSETLVSGEANAGEVDAKKAIELLKFIVETHQNPKLTKLLDELVICQAKLKGNTDLDALLTKAALRMKCSKASLKRLLAEELDDMLYSRDEFNGTLK